jgi:hypothetical protein
MQRRLKAKRRRSFYFYYKKIFTPKLLQALHHVTLLYVFVYTCSFFMGTAAATLTAVCCGSEIIEWLFAGIASAIST